MLIKKDGTLWALGENEGNPNSSIFGLGIEYDLISSPAQVGNFSDWRQISCSYGASYGIRENNTLWVSGDHELYDIFQSPLLQHTQLGTSTDWKQVCASGSGALAVKTTGALWGWGDTLTANVQSPIQIGSMSDWSQCALAEANAYAVKQNGTLWWWGNSYTWGQPTISSPVQMGSASDWKEVSCSLGGETIVNGIKTNGTLWGWGRNDSGQAGLPYSATYYFLPVQVGTYSDWTKVAHNWLVHTMGIHGTPSVSPVAIGNLWGWGASYYGELVNGLFNNPTPISITDTTTVWKDIGCGDYHWVAIKNDGTMWSNGRNHDGQLGQSDTIDHSSPIQIGTLTDWKTISCGYSTNAAIKSDGTLWTWGNDYYGSLGLGINTGGISRSSPCQVGTMSNWKDVSVGGNETVMGITSNGKLWGMGLGTHGQLGLNSSNQEHEIPFQVGILDDWKNIFTSDQSAVAIKTDGTLWGWGSNYFGNLGIGHQNDISSPVQIGSMSDWSHVAMSFHCTIAVKTNGTLWGMGSPYEKELLNGSTTPILTPIMISNLSNWKTVWSNKEDVNLPIYYGIKTDGTLWGWGSNRYPFYSQTGNYTYLLGGNNFSDSVISSPIQIGSLSNWLKVGQEFFKAVGLTGTKTCTDPEANWKTAKFLSNAVVGLKLDNSIWSWGYNEQGQLGHNDNIWRSSPAQIGALTDWNKLACGTAHALTIKTNGTLWTWGSDNSKGLLGLNDNINRSSPCQVGTLSDWKEIENYCVESSYAIKTNGTLWTWGENNGGQLGLNDVFDRSSPCQVGTLSTWTDITCGWGSFRGIRLTGEDTLPVTCSSPVQMGGELWYSGYKDEIVSTDISSPVQIGIESNWDKISGNWDSFFVIKDDGTLWANGLNWDGMLGLGHSLFAYNYDFQQVGTLSDWKEVRCAETATLGIKTDGTLWYWGAYNSQCAFGTLGTNYAESSPVQLGSLSNWKSINACDDNIFHALKTDGTIWSWGWGWQGPLGLGDQIDRSSPCQIGSMSNWAKLSTWYSLNAPPVGAIKTDGTLWMWGSGWMGALGLGNEIWRSSPTQVGLMSDWADIKPGCWHTLALKTNGTLWSWGGNWNGDLGLGYAGNFAHQSSPCQIGSMSNWAKITCGYYSAAIKTDGTLWAWGNAQGGSLGLNTNNINYSSPTQVGTLSNWSDAYSTYYRSFAIKNRTNNWLNVPCPDPNICSSPVIVTSTTGWGWGQCLDGSLGIGDRPIWGISSPMQIGSLNNWSVLAPGNYTSAGIKPNGTLWSWGSNDWVWGGFGNYIGYSSSPVQVGSMTDWKDVSCGYHALMTKTNGTLWATGSNDEGQLGLGDDIYRSSPVQVGLLSDWNKIIAGRFISYSIKTNNTLWRWGRVEGVDTLSPVQLGTLSDWAHISTMWANSAAIKTDGTLWVWGVGWGAGLGLGDTINRSSPTQVGLLSNWKTVAISDMATAAIKTDGTLWAWGSNIDGAVGVNDTIARSSPVQVGSMTDWKDVKVGAQNTFAIKNNGTLWAWGINWVQHHLGIGTTISDGRSSPTQVGSLSDWSSISCSYNNSMGIRNTTEFIGYEEKLCSSFSRGSKLYSWGIKYGGLGLGDMIDRSSPCQIGVLENWNNFSLGEYNAFAIKIDGTLWSWGSTGHFYEDDEKKSSPIQIGALTDWQQVSVENHVGAIKIDGTLWVWGNNSGGKCGYPETIWASSPIQVGSLSDWKEVTCGMNTTFAIKTNGTLWGWGYTSDGLLPAPSGGTYFWEAISSPVQIGSLTNWKQINASEFVAHAIKTDSTLWSWGDNTRGEFGNGISGDLVTNISSPIQIGLMSNWNKVSKKTFCRYSLALKTDGTIWSWGENFHGRLGMGDNIDRSSPVQIGSMTNWKDIACGYAAAATKTDGTLWTWGQNTQYHNNCGLGDNIDRSSPCQVGTLSNWNKVESSMYATLASQGEVYIKPPSPLKVWGCGYNDGGELGHGDRIQYTSPILMLGDDYKYIATGEWEQSFAIKTDGTLWGCGYNDVGQLGLGYTSSGQFMGISSPTQVGDTSNWKTIAMNRDHVMAVKTDGTMWTWGNDDWGMLGHGTLYENRSSPTQVGTSTNWKDIAPGDTHSLAIKIDNTLWSWGSTSDGQLGLGDNWDDRSSPTQVGTMNNWKTVSCGGRFSIAIKTDGTLWGWGSYANGALGQADQFSRSSPTQIGTATNWNIISCGYSQSTAIKTDGTLWTWGIGNSGQGGGTGTYVDVPTQIGLLGDWSKLSNNHTGGWGSERTFAIKTNGTLWAWGDIAGCDQLINENKSSPVQLGSLSNWTQVSCNSYHWIGITDDTLTPITPVISSPVQVTPSNELWFCGYDQIPLSDSTGPAGVGNADGYFKFEHVGDNWSSIAILNSSGWDNSVVATKADGTLWGWGGNRDSIIGFGDNIERSSPCQIGLLNNWKTVSSAAEWSWLAIKTNGTLWGCGYNWDGLLGVGNTIRYSSPIQVGSLSDWSSVSGKPYGWVWAHFAIKTDGTLWGWGQDDYGILTGTTIGAYRYSSPIQVGTSNDWKQVAASVESVKAIKTNGTLWTWGWNINGQLGLGDYIDRSSPTQVGTLSNWSFVDSHYDYNIAIKTDGTLWGWGNDHNGYLPDITSPETLDTFIPRQIGALNNWKTVFVSWDNVIATKTDGTLWGWGLNPGFDLGDWEIVNYVSSPVQIGIENTWEKAIIDADYFFGFKTTVNAPPLTSNTLWAWGANTWGQIGTNDDLDRSSPVQVGLLNDWNTIEEYYQSSYGIKTNGTLWSWGANSEGGLGLGDVYNNRSSPCQVGTLSNWKQISAGRRFFVSVKTDGTLWSCGYNWIGTLGNGISGYADNRSSPIQIGILDYWDKVSCGYYHTIAKSIGGGIWGWGENESGELGLGDDINRSSPVQIGTGFNWKQISAGEYASTMAVKTNGTLWAWGWNSHGQLGLENILGYSVPTQVGTLSNWEQVSIYYSTGAVKTDGTLWSWGWNGDGGLGLGDKIHRSSPTQIGSLNNWRSVEIGDSALFATKTDRTLWACGEGVVWGSLGASNTLDYSSPIQIGTLSDWNEISSYDNVTLATREILPAPAPAPAPTYIKHWGAGYFPALDKADYTNYSSPVQLSSNWTYMCTSGDVPASFFIDKNKNLWGVGNIYGAYNKSVSAPVMISNTGNWESVNCHGSTMMGIKSDNTLWMIGYNGFGEGGIGDYFSRSSPVQIGTKTTWNKVVCGYHTIAIGENNTLWGWGNNNRGQTGQGVNGYTSMSSPVQIGVDTDWRFIAIGTEYSTAIKTNNTLWGWGVNFYGNLLLNSFTTQSTSSPVQLGTLSNWKNVTCDDSTVYGIQNNNTLWGWGGTSYSLLKTVCAAERTIDPNFELSSPVQIGTLSDWGEIGGGGVPWRSFIARKINGTLWAWGETNYAYTSNGAILNQINHSSPIQIGTLSNWSKVWGAGYAWLATTDDTPPSNIAGWGNGTNWSGELGIGEINNQYSSPVQLISNVDWKQLAAPSERYAYNSNGIKTDGSLWVWGQTPYNGYVYNVSTPIKVGTSNDWAYVHCSAMTTVMIKTDGTAWGMGYNYSGELGMNPNIPISSPVQIAGGNTWSKAWTAESNRTILLNNNGSLWVMGWDWENTMLGLGAITDLGVSSPVQIGTDLNWKQASVNEYHTLAVKTNGTLWSWGRDVDGVLGQNTSSVNLDVPTQVGLLSNWKQVHADGSASFAIKTDGTLWSWGYNGGNILGHGDSIDKSSPTQVGSLSDWDKLASSGHYCMMMIKTNGTLWACGYNTDQMITPDDTVWEISAPMQVGTLSTWKDVSGSHTYWLGITDSTPITPPDTPITGTGRVLVGCGSNMFGQLGTGDTIDHHVIIQIGDKNDWSSVSDSYSTLGIRADNSLWATGWNGNGELGTGDIIHRSSPTQIIGSWKQQCTNAIKTDGTLWGWGENSGGALGLGDEILRSSPTQVGSMSDWASISGTNNNVAAIKTNGSLWGWGYNTPGCLGLGHTNSVSSPTQIGSLTTWSKLGSNFRDDLLAIKTDGTLWGCGSNYYGKLGLGYVSDHITVFGISSPTQIGTLTNWKQITCGYFNDLTMAVKTDGTLWGWGDLQTYGNYLNNDFINHGIDHFMMSPIQIGTLSNWSKVSALAGNYYMLNDTGALWGWGYNVNGELGQGNTIIYSSPVQIGPQYKWVDISAQNPTFKGIIELSDTGGVGGTTTTVEPFTTTIPLKITVRDNWGVFNGKLIDKVKQHTRE